MWWRWNMQRHALQLLLHRDGMQLWGHRRQLLRARGYMWERWPLLRAPRKRSHLYPTPDLRCPPLRVQAHCRDATKFQAGTRMRARASLAACAVDMLRPSDHAESNAE